MQTNLDDLHAFLVVIQTSLGAAGATYWLIKRLEVALARRRWKVPGFLKMGLSVVCSVALPAVGYWGQALLGVVHTHELTAPWLAGNNFLIAHIIHEVREGKDARELADAVARAGAGQGATVGGDSHPVMEAGATGQPGVTTLPTSTKSVPLAPIGPQEVQAQIEGAKK